ncbi:MAG: hypothetical protein IKZ16_07990, partial [Clostridia bacterium]|nr:hypothetical protein [Clostridia bacterium]
MKQTAKLGCRILVAVLCLAMFASVITVPAFAAETPGLSSLAGGDLGFLMGLLQQYNNVKNDPDAAEQMKEYVENQYNSDETFKESADSMLGSNTEGEENKTLDNLNSVIDNVFTEEFTITWKVGDEIVAEDVYKYGETPVYTGETPVKADDEHYSYTFVGWSPVIMAVKGAATYVAVFSATELHPVADGYTVTFVTGNGTVVRSFEIGAAASDAGIVTDKATDANFSYTFIGWDKVIDADGNQTWTAKYEKTAVEKSWSDILTSGKVVEEYFGSIDNVMDAVQNGASVEDLKESIQHQQQVEQNKAEDPDYVEPTYKVTWKLDGKVVATQEYTYKKLIQQPGVDAISAGKYVSWTFDYVLMPKEDITIKGETVDIVEEIIADVNGMPFNYGEYEMVYKNGVATLYVNVDATNYNDILRDVLGDVRGGGAQSAYKEAIMAFLQSAAMHMYNSKTNTVDVNGYEVFGIEGYSASQLIELMADVQAGNYGKLISTEGIKQAVLSEPVGLSTLANLGNDGVLTSYDVTLGANGKQDYTFELQIALKGNVSLIRNAAKALSASIDFTKEHASKLDNDLYVEITVPAAFTMSLRKALNNAAISDETKQLIISALSESATVGELLSAFDLLTYEQFTDVLNYMLDSVSTEGVDDAAVVEKLDAIRPAFDLMQKYGDILIDKVPESVSGKEASVTIKSIYNIIQAVSYEDMVALTQLKDADALVGSAKMDAAVAAVAAKLNVSETRAQAIVDRMVEAFADYQNRMPDSAKAQTAYNYTDKLIDALFNRIPAKFQDAKLTDTYKGDGEFSWAFDTTYNPGAWLKNVLAGVSFTAYGRTIVFADYIPSHAFTSEVEITVNVSGLYSVTFMDGDKVVFKGFLPYKAQLAPYYTNEKVGHDLIWVDEEGNELTVMPGADTVVYAKYVAHEYTITFVDEDGTVLDSGIFAHGITPVYNG